MFDGDVVLEAELDDVGVIDSLLEAMIVWDTDNVPNSFNDGDTVDDWVRLRVTRDEVEGVGLVDNVFDLKLVEESDDEALTVIVE